MKAQARGGKRVLGEDSMGRDTSKEGTREKCDAASDKKTRDGKREEWV